MVCLWIKRQLMSDPAKIVPMKNIQSNMRKRVFAFAHAKIQQVAVSRQQQIWGSFFFLWAVRVYKRYLEQKYTCSIVSLKLETEKCHICFHLCWVSTSFLTLHEFAAHCSWEFVQMTKQHDQQPVSRCCSFWFWSACMSVALKTAHWKFNTTLAFWGTKNSSLHCGASGWVSCMNMRVLQEVHRVRQHQGQCFRLLSCSCTSSAVWPGRVRIAPSTYPNPRAQSGLVEIETKGGRVTSPPPQLGKKQPRQLFRVRIVLVPPDSISTGSHSWRTRDVLIVKSQVWSRKSTPWKTSLAFSIHFLKFENVFGLSKELNNIALFHYFCASHKANNTSAKGKYDNEIGCAISWKGSSFESCGHDEFSQIASTLAFYSSGCCSWKCWCWWYFLSRKIKKTKGD